MAKNKVAWELEAISLVLDQNSAVLDLVFRDLGKYQRTDPGRDDMTPEQVVRGAILKEYRELTYGKGGIAFGALAWVLSQTERRLETARRR